MYGRGTSGLLEGERSMESGTLEPPNCPECNSPDVVPIVYGHPGRILLEMAHGEEHLALVDPHPALGRRLGHEYRLTLFEVEGIKQFQIVQKTIDLVVIKIVKESTFDEKQLEIRYFENTIEVNF